MDLNAANIGNNTSVSSPATPQTSPNTITEESVQPVNQETDGDTSFTFADKGLTHTPEGREFVSITDVELEEGYDYLSCSNEVATKMSL